MNSSRWQEEYREYKEVATIAATQYADSVGRELAKLRRDVEVESHISDSLTEHIGRMNADRENLRQQNVQLKREVESKLAENPCDCTPALELINSLEDEIIQQSEQIAALEERDSSRLFQITALSTALDVSTSLADSLQTVILNLPEPEEHKILGLFNISSREILILGVASGLVIGTVVF
jgi:predicted RNase H-like nuclease (RuvC/YqgF family)